MVFLVSPILENFSTNPFFGFPCRIFVKVFSQENIDLEWKFLCNIAQTKLDFVPNHLTSCRAFAILVSVLQLSSKASLALCWDSSASQLLSSLVPAFPFALASLSDSSLAFLAPDSVVV